MNASPASNPSRRLAPAVLVAVLSGFLASCAVAGKPGGGAAEPRLIAAGFTKTLAASPQKLEQYRSLPQRQVLPYGKGGATFYVYADVNGCGCIYEGNEDAYRRYRQAGGTP